jgi:predicted SAM-dependent methyltransferase
MSNDLKETSPIIIRNILEHLTTIDLMNIRYIAHEILNERGWIAWLEPKVEGEKGK